MRNRPDKQFTPFLFNSEDPIEGVHPLPAEIVIGDDGDSADNQSKRQPEMPESLPILPVRQVVLFPGTIVPLNIGRPSSRQLLDQWLPKSKLIGISAQKDPADETPGLDDLYAMGTLGMVLKLIRQPDETVSVIVHGIHRIYLDQAVSETPYITAKVSRPEEKPGSGKKYDAGLGQLRDQAHQLIDLSSHAPEQATTVLMNIPGGGPLADFLAANLEIDLEQKQDLLDELDVAKRVRQVHQYVSSQLEVANLQHKIQQDVQSSIDQSQRRYFLHEQMKAIQKELGEDGSSSDQIAQQLRERIKESDPPKKVIEEAERELNRLEMIPPASPEYSVLTSYLELISELPWNKASEDNLDLQRAKKTLDRDHFDLEKVKKRLIEFLAVRKLNPKGRGAILCLVGPPGVGKTSLGQSVADALGRKFARMSLGGIRDEAEIRGHRRTYIGAMPGRIIQELRRAGTNNPVMMLDEVDKLGADFRGDPASALLEVLDPRQNNEFVDRYLDVPFDLSQIIFIATANYIGAVPEPLQDRMEVIDIPGYTDNDKVQIARKYLAPRQIKENGLTRSQCKWQVAGIKKVIESYTREAGVRELERQIGSVCRAVAAKVAREDDAVVDKKKTSRATKNKKKLAKTKARAGQAPVIDAGKVRELLGPEKFQRELDTAITTPGVVLGLAYTSVGGEILFIEATSYPGKGAVTLTGHIGDVMKESASAAMSLFKSRASQFNIDIDKLNEKDIHIHVPAGAVPKDGPSAGIAMYTAIASLILGLPVKNKLAMTGEITLRNKVLPIGGVKEKTLAAARAGVKTVLLPAQNENDLEDADDKVKKQLDFKFVDNLEQVLDHALGAENIKRVAKKNKSLSSTKS